MEAFAILGRQAVRLYFQSEEAQEGKNAFLEKRKPNSANT